MKTRAINDLGRQTIGYQYLRFNKRHFVVIIYFVFFFNITERNRKNISLMVVPNLDVYVEALSAQVAT